MRPTTFLIIAVSLWINAAAACDEAAQLKADETFKARCIACHNDRSRVSDLSLEQGGAALIGQPSRQVPRMNWVTAGDQQASYLFRKITGTHRDAGGIGSRMPIGPALSDQQIAEIERWIQSCADTGRE